MTNESTIEVRMGYRGQEKEHLLAENPDRRKSHLCLQEEDSGLLPSTYKKKSPQEKVGLAQKALGDISLVTFMICTLM